MVFVLQRLRFRERSELCVNPLTARLLSIMDKKKTNLAVSADVKMASRLLEV